ncbi:HAD family hydrolase [Sulfitobacter alexandrii]|uniref:HAD family hydrolase n=1 Tax=Sulfitobacter alexandrii TaxID=1917485 RepID=A0A1J0WDF4_9RHOB|nr:HAD-IA family hydrolase [Sulfitobacter alexandrii]APE42349.1 HAD family hydrolase [Sulfitobacter alexandrii]
MTVAPLGLVIFDVDGTLVDSQHDIVAAMAAAFDAVQVPPPSRAEVLGIVGLSLDVAMATLAPTLGAGDHARMVVAYKSAYMDLRAQAGVAESSPLYPGARAALEALRARDDVLLGVATGKSKRGLDKLVEGHGLHGMFQTLQCADFHPSKPHPSMLLTALAETGVDADRAVMVGDTSFDMDMAQAAGIAGIGVGWGYHDRSRLSGARHVIDRFEALPDVLDEIWGVPA